LNALSPQDLEHQQGQGQVREVLVFLVLALVTLVVRGAWFGDANADIDEQLYSLIGNAMTHGALPYVDLWDRKPIGLFALYAAAHEVGGPGPLAYQLLATLFSLGGAWLTYRLSRRLVDPLTACAAGVLYIALMSTYFSHSGQSEVFHVPLMLGMLTLVVDPAHPRFLARARWAMLLGGLALQVKYTVLPQCMLFGGWALWHRYRAGLPLRRVAREALGFAALGLLPTVAVGLGYALAGHLDAFVFANFTSFFDRLQGPVGRFGNGGLELFLMPLAILIFGGLICALGLNRPRDRRTYLLYVLWLIATAATIYLPSTVYLYYYAAAVPAAVLVSLPLLDRHGPMRFVPLVLILAGSAHILFLPRQYAQSREQTAELARLAAAIAPHVDARTHCLWVFDGPASLYRLSGSCLPTRFIYPDHLNNALERNALGVSQAGEVARILGTQPPVIVTADTVFTPQNPDAKRLVDTTVAQDYREIAHARLSDRTIRAWLRKDAPPPR
jgi:hypothetical protein